MTLGLSHNNFTLNSTTPTLLTVPANQEDEYHLTLTVQNLDVLYNVYLGSSSVSTTSFGYQLLPGGVFSGDLLPNEDIYAVCDSGQAVKVAVIWLKRL